MLYILLVAFGSNHTVLGWIYEYSTVSYSYTGTKHSLTKLTGTLYRPTVSIIPPFYWHTLKEAKRRKEGEGRKKKVLGLGLLKQGVRACPRDRGEYRPTDAQAFKPS
ncbi:hypothetical protein HOY80DRAFT_782915 [Tuber brumale]|nr:hypothetical protein HOY80DRAFT_782915 [Tuber brumale]